MKRIAIAAIGLSVASCAYTISITPIPKEHPVTHIKRHEVQAKHKSSPGSKSKWQTKETWWIENYHKLEAAHGEYTISADADIEPLENGKFRVPPAVVQHYQDLLLSK